MALSATPGGRGYEERATGWVEEVGVRGAEVRAPVRVVGGDVPRRDSLGVAELHLLTRGVPQLFLVDEHHTLGDLVRREDPLEVLDDLIGGDRVGVVADRAQHDGLAEQRVGDRHDAEALQAIPLEELRADLLR